MPQSNDQDPQKKLFASNREIQEIVKAIKGETTAHFYIPEFNRVLKDEDIYFVITPQLAFEYKLFEGEVENAWLLFENELTENGFEWVMQYSKMDHNIAMGIISKLSKPFKLSWVFSGYVDEGLWRIFADLIGQFDYGSKYHKDIKSFWQGQTKINPLQSIAMSILAGKPDQKEIDQLNYLDREQVWDILKQTNNDIERLQKWRKILFEHLTAPQKRLLI